MRIAIAGAGIGGLTLAALLHKQGHEVELVEKAREFGDVGAGIQISPNGSRVLAHLGLREALDRVGTIPEQIVLRRWEDDALLLARPMGAGPAERYGHGYYNVYRPDLIDLLASACGGVATRFDAEFVGARTIDDGAAIELADGATVEADVVIGADGIHSAVRSSIFGDSQSRFSGSVAYRALVPSESVPDVAIEVTNRMGPGSHVVSYFVGEGQRFFNLVCVVPDPEFDTEGWMEPGSLAELRSHFASWSPQLNQILGHVVEPVYRWALHDRPPIEAWSMGHVTLLGDACHPMLPFMAQGACQAIEDAAILSRLLDGAAPADVPRALHRYEQIRQPRAAELQHRSWRNADLYHMRDGPEQNVRDDRLRAVAGDVGESAFDWLYGYDALSQPLHG